MSLKPLLKSAVFSVLLAMPVGGFVFGFVHATHCAWWNIVGRGFIGVIFAVLTPLCWGHPPQNEGGVGEPFNVWPYIYMVQD